MLQVCYRGLAGMPAERARKGLSIPMNPRGMLHFYNGSFEDFLFYGAQELEKGEGYGGPDGVIIKSEVSLREEDGWIIPEDGRIS